MSTQTFNAQTRIPVVLMEDVKRKLDRSGMTISEYIRNLIMIDVGRFPVNIPEMKLNPKQERRILTTIEELKRSEGIVVSNRKEINDHLESLLNDK